jgi:zinc protease
MNRKASPPINDIGPVLLPRPQLVRLDNGMPVYVLHVPGQEIVKVEVVYRAGRPQERKRLAARATASMLREGTSARSSAEIAELIDFYGGSLSLPSSLDTAGFILFSVKKYAHELIPLFAEVLQDPVFPEDELETFRRNNIQELQVELEKVEVLAYRKVTELIFGENHPYGYNSVPEDYLKLTRDDLVQHFEACYAPSNALVVASGAVDEAVLELLNRHLGQNRRSGAPPAFEAETPSGQPSTLRIFQPGSLQTAIKIGRRTFNRKHPDFNGLYVLNTILGGYFGSRLMANIREKRGFTYNIYSTADALEHDGCLYVATEVNSDKTAATIRQIFAEMKKLREAPVEADELAMVRNYLLGMQLNGLDGPLNTSDVIKTLLADELPWEAFDQLVETIRTITPGELQDLARQYLDPADYWTVIASAPPSKGSRRLGQVPVDGLRQNAEAALD